MKKGTQNNCSVNSIGWQIMHGQCVFWNMSIFIVAHGKLTVHRRGRLCVCVLSVMCVLLNSMPIHDFDAPLAFDCAKCPSRYGVAFNTLTSFAKWLDAVYQFNIITKTSLLHDRVFEWNSESVSKCMRERMSELVSKSVSERFGWPTIHRGFRWFYILWLCSVGWVKQLAGYTRLR